MEIRIKGGNRDNIGIMESGVSEENIDQRENNYFQNLSTDISMHSLHWLVCSKDIFIYFGMYFFELVVK